MELLSTTIECTDSRNICPCPKCKNGQMVFYPKVVKCKDENCGLTVFRIIAKKRTDGQLIDLLINGKTVLVKGFVSSKTGSIFDAIVKFDADYKTIFEFPPRKGDSKKKRS